LADDTIRVELNEEALDEMTWEELALVSDYFTNTRNSGTMMRELIVTLDPLCKVSVNGKPLASLGRVKRRYLKDVIGQVTAAIYQFDSGN